jgi:lysophospholipase L1-like esterase
MTYTILTIAVVLVLALTLCGSKDKPAPGPKLVTFYGDSATYGGYFQDGALQRYSPDPVSLVQSASGGALQCLNRAMNGLTLHELLTGGRVEMAVTGLGEPGEIAPLAVQLTTDPSQIIVLGCGNVDALFGTRGAQVFADDLRTAVDEVRVAGKIPVIRGLNRFLQAGPVDAWRLTQRDAFHATARLVAAEDGVAFIDIDAAGDPELCWDQLHPSTGYHQRIAEVIAQTLKGVKDGGPAFSTVATAE